MKKLLLLLNIMLFVFNVNASHIMGGEITWKCLKVGSDAGKYVFQMKIYSDCSTFSFSQSPQTLVHHNYPTVGDTAPILMNFILVSDISPTGTAASGNTCFTCANGDVGAVEEYIFESDPLVFGGAPPAEGWHFTWGTFSRSGSITNLTNSSSQFFTLRAVMYPYNDPSVGILLATPCYDSSPEFNELPKTIICTGYPFAYSDNASDQELDEITYSWAEPLGEAALYDPINTSATALAFMPPYSVTSPIPGNPTLDSQTGEIAFSSNTMGVFVTCVKAEARKCGQIVAEIYRESQVGLIICPTSTNGMINNPPAITAPLGAQIWNTTINSAGLPSYSTTVTSGELVSFSINAEDLDMYSNNTPQYLTMTISGEPLSSGYINPLLCANPPCATFTELGGSPPPIVAASLVSGVFEWQTSSDHITANGCNNPSSVFVFSIKVYDDFCPVNGITIATIKVTVITPPSAIEEHITNKKLLKITGLLGRETKGKKNQPLFYIYDDGTVEKRIVIE
jgi:hypothetical protein